MASLSHGQACGVPPLDTIGAPSLLPSSRPSGKGWVSSPLAITDPMLFGAVSLYSVLSETL